MISYHFQKQTELENELDLPILISLFLTVTHSSMNFKMSNFTFKKKNILEEQRKQLFIPAKILTCCIR